MGERQRKFYDALIRDLVTFAKLAFRLDTRNEDGTTLREHLEAAEKASPGVTRGVLKRATMPPELEFLWLWYLDLSTSRQYAGMSGSPLRLTHTEILAWATLHQIALEPWQLRAIRLIDSHHVHAMMKAADGFTMADLQEA